MNDIGFTKDEILKFAIESGMINISSIGSELNMSKRKECIQNHKYDIWQGKNGNWYTYLPDEAKGRILKKRKTREDIEDAIVNHYNDIAKKTVYTFKDSFYENLEEKREIISPNTYVRYEKDYERFFKGSFLETEAIENINSRKLDVFIIKKTKELGLKKKALKAMYSHLKSGFFYARINRHVTENPFDFMKPVRSYTSYCVIEVLDARKRTVSINESKLLQERFKYDHEYKPNYMPTYAVELSVLTGMRVGEIAALTWEVIKDGAIIICREEIMDVQNNIFYVADYTKNRRPRVIPITDEIQDLFDRIEKVQKENGTYGKYVFMNENGRINKRMISDCARNKSMQVGIDVKSIHAHRRTLNSVMKTDGVSNIIASSILGNTEEVNDNYYTYDMADLNRKKEILTSAQRKVKCL